MGGRALGAAHGGKAVSSTITHSNTNVQSLTWIPVWCLRPMKAQMEAEIAAAEGDELKIDKIRAGFASKERAVEHEIDHRPLDVHLQLGVSYNVFLRDQTRIPCFDQQDPDNLLCVFVATAVSHQVETGAFASTHTAPCAHASESRVHHRF